MLISIWSDDLYGHTPAELISARGQLKPWISQRFSSRYGFLITQLESFHYAFNFVAVPDINVTYLKKRFRSKEQSYFFTNVSTDTADIYEVLRLGSENKRYKIGEGWCDSCFYK